MELHSCTSSSSTGSTWPTVATQVVGDEVGDQPARVDRGALRDALQRRGAAGQRGGDEGVGGRRVGADQMGAVGGGNGVCRRDRSAIGSTLIPSCRSRVICGADSAFRQRNKPHPRHPSAGRGGWRCGGAQADPIHRVGDRRIRGAVSPSTRPE